MLGGGDKAVLAGTVGSRTIRGSKGAYICRPCEGRDPASFGTPLKNSWVPAFAGTMDCHQDLGEDQR